MWEWTCAINHGNYLHLSKSAKSYNTFVKRGIVDHMLTGDLPSHGNIMREGDSALGAKL